MNDKAAHRATNPIAKASSGIRGLDEITEGGLPKGGVTLFTGNAGCGKTVFSMQFLARGALDCDEPGVFVALEEQPEVLVRNFVSLGLDLQDLIDRRLLAFVQVGLADTAETAEGRYDIGSCFIRLSEAIASVNARRVAIDTLDSLYVGVENFNLLRIQLRGMFNWLRARGLTVAATGEAGIQTLTRRGVEDYLADCVIKLDYRVDQQLSTRRLRVVKYRGASHPSDEFPFLIDEKGITVVPITSARLQYRPTGRHLSTGVPDLDRMLNAGGFSRGSSILVSGTPGSGKTSLAFKFIDAACRRGEMAAYFGFEESAEQLYQDMASIGLDIRHWVEKGLLHIYSTRASMRGLESHLVNIYRAIEEFAPSIVVVDPISSLSDVGTVMQAKSVLTRLIDFLKMHATTALFTDLVHIDTMQVTTREEISSMIDTWLLLRDREDDNERIRTFLIVKSRGMAHCNEICRFRITDNGITIRSLAPPAERRSGQRRSGQDDSARDEVERRSHERRSGQERRSGCC